MLGGVGVVELEGAVLTLRLDGGLLLDGVDLGLSVLASSISGVSVPSCLMSLPTDLTTGIGLGDSVSVFKSSDSFRRFAAGSPVSTV